MFGLRTSFLTLGLIFCWVGSGFAQGTVRGKITDETGETIIGVSVVFKNNPSNGVISDFDGNFSIDIPSAEPTILVFSFIGMTTLEKTVNPKNGEVQVIGVGLKSKDFQIGEVVIEARANKAGDYYMEKIKKNSATSIDYISSETMRRTGDSDVSAAMQRVPGVSSVGGNLSVRGLADRYIFTTVNGLSIPTLDPFTNNLNLDIFPSALVDNIVVTKTGSPDLSGDWSGAFVSLETKDYPDKFFLSYSSSIGYNTNATFSDIVSSQGSSTDWLGWDNGYRDVPEGVPTTQEEFPALVTNFNETNRFEQYRILGLENYLNGYGITASTPLADYNAYNQLALIGLNLMGPAEFGDANAIDAGLSAYEDQYGAAYFFPIFNAELGEIGQKFNANMTTIRKTAPLDMSHTLTVGNRSKLFKRDFGFIAGVRYSRSTQYDASGSIARSNQPPDFTSTSSDNLSLYANLLDVTTEASQETANLSAMVSASLKLNQNNSISLIFMPNFIGENNARILNGFQNGLQTGAELRRFDQFYQERRHLIYQANSTHYLPGIGSKLNFDISYTDGRRNEPDFKSFALEYDPEMETYQVENVSPQKAFRVLDDDLLHLNTSLEIPLSQEMRSLGFMKFGGSYLRNTRENLQTIYNVEGRTGQILQSLDNPFPIEGFSTEGLSSPNLYYSVLSNRNDRDIGRKEVFSGFAMADYNFTTRIRLQGGLRAEYTEMFADLYFAYRQELPNDDPERPTAAGGAGKANASKISETSYLPSINVIYKLKEWEENPINLRINYFKSIGRPGLREISSLGQEDYVLLSQVAGNPNLRIAQINNYDARLESYFRNNNNVSLSVFYKQFKDHIELVDLSYFTWVNTDKSYALGLEIGGQWSIVKSLVLQGNISLIQSETTVSEPVPTTRSMFGQAPYIVNGMLSHKWEKGGLTSSISYNVQGPKLAVVGRGGDNITYVYEMPRHRIDMQVIKTLGEHFSASLAVRDLLNTPVRRAYRFDSGYEEVDFDHFKWGTVIRLGVSYTL